MVIFSCVDKKKKRLKANISVQHAVGILLFKVGLRHTICMHYELTFILNYFYSRITDRKCVDNKYYTQEKWDDLHVYMHLLHQWFVATNICETVVFAILVDYISRIEAILNLFDSKYRDREGVYTAIMNNEYVQYIIPSLS